MGKLSQIGFWERLSGWFIDNKLIVFVLVLLLFGFGVYVSPFDWQLGSFPRDPVPVDAIPDIGENQQIVFTTWPGRSPRDIEDQVTYPLTTALLGIPGVRTIRSSSAFGFSTIYVIFHDDVEFYWSRSRVLEKLASLPSGTVPKGANPVLGPDATALGQIFWYTLEGRDQNGNVVGGWDQHELRSIQDWIVRYSLQSVQGVAEVASVGGFVKEYQVDVDPEAMRANGVSLQQVAKAVQDSNLDVGARTIEINRVEYMVRGLGFVKGIADLEKVVVAIRDHTPVRIADVARVTLGPALRRGALDDAGAPAVGGVVVARFGENPLAAISAVKQRIAEIAPGLPKRTLDDGTISQVTIAPFYDRTELIHETLDTLSTALFQEILITIIVVLVMLRNLRSSVVISSMLPLGVLFAFLIMKVAGVDANIMSLAGIAIAIGTMVDISIIFVENISQHLDEAPEDAKRAVVIRRATAEVAPAVVTSVLTTLAGFLPVFGLTSAEARLFTPLAFTKTFTMGGTLILSIIVLPGLCHVFFRQRPKAPAIVSGQHAVWRVARSIVRPLHLRDWVLLVLGSILIIYTVLPGIFVVLMAVFRFARPFLGKRLKAGFTFIENTLAIIAVTVALAADWLPLGPGNGFFLNAIFVGAIILGLLATFRGFEMIYPFFLRLFLNHKAAFLIVPTIVAVLGISAWLGFGRLFIWLPESIRTSGPYVAMDKAFPGFGREYMPSFDEGSYLYMPTTMPHASIGQVLEMLKEMDARTALIPEVDRVVGKLGRVESPLDPAPVSMIETVITYVPEYRTQADGTRVRQWRDHIRNPKDIWDEITKANEQPGMTGAPMLMPISTRIVMLQSGMRAPMGIKVQGPDLETIQAFGLRLETILREVPDLRPETVFADRVVGKPYIEIDIDREAIARYGLTIGQVQAVLQVALGGMTLSKTVEGRERYPIRVRYMREERDAIPAIGRIFVPTPSGEQIPLNQLASIVYVRGPQVIKSEDTFLTSYVLFDKKPHVAEVEAVEQAGAIIADKIATGALEVPAGVSYRFAGSYENQLRSEKRLAILIPIALAVVFMLLYFQFHRVIVSGIIYTGVFVAVTGGFLLIWCYGQPWFLDVDVFGVSMRDLFDVRTVNLSVAVWVGFIALIGIATDDGVVISTYLNQRFKANQPKTIEDIRKSTLEAGKRRIRPCLMTTATTILALLPVITSHGRGSDVMVPMAIPSVGGMAIELMTLFLVPVLFSFVEEMKLRFSLKTQDYR
ncbi:MAG: efflux RND transporter permease subunit [Myxococcota bacterium]|nr:efflux RND transporter permease subunit [Myxococcota bacterium]